MPQNPTDLRERRFRAQDAGLTAAEIERSFGVSRRSLRRWRQWARERDGVADRRRAGHPRAIPADAETALRAQVAAHADVTLV